MGYQGKHCRPRKKRTGPALLLLALLLLGVCGRLIWLSYFQLTVREFALSSSRLSQELRLAVLSDLHGQQFGEDNIRLVDCVRSQSPDLILLAGDMLNSYDESAQAVTALVRRLSDIAPVYYALGNHELGYMRRTGEALPDALEQAGAQVLELSWQDIEIKGQPLRIGGMYDYAFALDGHDSTNPETMDPELYSFLTGFQNTDRFRLMLSHRPESFVLGQASATWFIDLVVSGHDHGGQVVLPVLGGLWAGDQGWLPDYVHGLYRKDRLCIFITSGLGSQREPVPRFNNPPEAAVLILSPAA